MCFEQRRRQELVGTPSDIIFAMEVFSWYKVVNTSNEAAGTLQPLYCVVNAKYDLRVLSIRSCDWQCTETMSSSSETWMSVHGLGLYLWALAYTPSQNCCSLSKVYKTSNSIAQVSLYLFQSMAEFAAAIIKICAGGGHGYQVKM